MIRSIINARRLIGTHIMCKVSPFPVQVRVNGEHVWLYSEADLKHIVSQSGRVKVFTVEFSSFEANLEAELHNIYAPRCELGLCGKG